MSGGMCGSVIGHFEGARPGANARALILQLEKALEEAKQNAEQLGTLRAAVRLLPEGSEPTVQVQYTEDAIVLDLGIPKGDTGAGGKDFTYEDFTPEQLAALEGKPGKDGEDGRDGYDPTVEIEKIEGGHKITITDRNGPNTAELHDGKDGKDGQDGYAPIVEIVKNEGGHKITITDRNGPQTAELRNGKDFTYEDFTPEQLEDLTGPRGPAGYSGVYVGSGTPPETANVWIDPEGEATRSETWVMTTEEGIEVDKHVVLIM